ncbi:unnamed protein product [Leuciscus chuanchicus]
MSPLFRLTSEVSSSNYEAQWVEPKSPSTPWPGQFDSQFVFMKCRRPTETHRFNSGARHGGVAFSELLRVLLTMETDHLFQLTGVKSHVNPRICSLQIAGICGKLNSMICFIPVPPSCDIDLRFFNRVVVDHNYTKSCEATLSYQSSLRGIWLKDRISCSNL